MHQGFQSSLIPGVSVGRRFFFFFFLRRDKGTMWGRRKARAICRVSKSLLDAGRVPECRSAAAKPYDLRQVCVGMRISLQGEYRIYVLFRSMLTHDCPRGYTLYHMYCTSTSYECSVELKSPYPFSSHKASEARQQGLPADGCAACARACLLHYLSIRVIDIERPRLFSPLLFPSRY